MSNELIRLGDTQAELGDWPGAVDRWHAAAGSGAVAEATIRFRAFLRRFGGPAQAGSTTAVPKRALTPLAIAGEAALLGVLALLAADRGPAGTDTVLLWLGWAGLAVSAGSALVFAARSGRLDGQRTRPTDFDNVTLEELTAQAKAVAARLLPATVVIQPNPDQESGNRLRRPQRELE